MNSITANINALIMGSTPQLSNQTANLTAAFSQVYAPQIPEGLAFESASGEMVSLETMVAAEMLNHSSSGLVDAMNNLTASASLTSALLDSVGSAVDFSV